MDSAAFDESSRAARTAARLGVTNTVLPLTVSPLSGLLEVVRSYDQPFWDSSAIPTLAVSRLARQAVSVILTGDGGDELFAGYRHHLAPWLADRVPWLPRPACQLVDRALTAVQPGRRSPAGMLLRFARGFPLDRGGRQLVWSTDLLHEAEKRTIWTASNVVPTEEWLTELLPPGLSALRTQLYGDIIINLHSDMLVKMDVGTMASSVEARCPLLDHELAEYLFTVPDRYLLGHGRRKRLLRDAYRGLISDEVLNGPKRGFEIPLRDWLNGELRELLHDTLAARGARVREWIRGDFVDALIATRPGATIRRPQVAYAILMLELWLRESAS
jgi:asparagine synthase (glutamine-hydrolysing)